MVLTALPTTLSQSRFGIITTKALGKAVVRNHTRRILRSALQVNLAAISAGWDVVIIARRPILDATYQQVLAALDILLKRASLLGSLDEHDGNTARAAAEGSTTNIR